MEEQAERVRMDSGCTGSLEYNKQLSQVQDFITKGVDTIVIAPTNSAGSKSMIEAGRGS